MSFSSHSRSYCFTPYHKNTNMECDENLSFIHSIWCSNSGDYEEYYPVRVTPFSAVEIYHTFGGTYCLHLHSLRINTASTNEEAVSWTSFLIIMLLTYYSILKMEAVFSSETSANFYHGYIASDQWKQYTLFWFICILFNDVAIHSKCTASSVMNDELKKIWKATVVA
jgi:hypothetical protein